MFYEYMVGIFDSGVGGLTVVKELRRQLPDCSFLYLGDTARTPYGSKSPDTIIRYAQEDAQFLVNKGAEAIIIACNTASAVATNVLREKFEVPIYEVITPAVKKAVAVSRGRIGVIGTTATIGSKIYPRLIENNLSYEAPPPCFKEEVGRGSKKIKVFSQACPLFVPLVEENWINRPETKMIARRYLMLLRQKNIDTLILGCTHYPLLKNIIQAKIGRQVKLIDSAEEVVSTLKHKNTKNTKTKCESKFFITDFTPKFQQIAERWLGEKIKVEKINLR